MKDMRFNASKFNSRAFDYSVKRTKGLKIDELKEAKVFNPNPDIKGVFSTNNASSYARVIVRGALDGNAVNYDGVTDLNPDKAKVFEQGVVVIGRAKGWTEKDFTFEYGGKDFMDGVAAGVAEYKDNLDISLLSSVLSGIFSMTGEENKKFVEGHTLDVSDEEMISATSLNDAAFKACGADKNKFTVILMHSNVATSLENLNLLEYMRYTDKEGISREIQLGTLSGRLVIVDDNLPHETNADGDMIYTSYILGERAFSYEDVGAKVPFEISRDPRTNGGEDTLYARQRKVIAPYGISYEREVQTTTSPTDEELRNGENWSLVNIDYDEYIDHKKIFIARILSK